MTDRDAAVDAVMKAIEVCMNRHGDDLAYLCPAVRAAVEQATADAYMQGWRDRFNEPIDKAELERQRGAR